MEEDLKDLRDKYKEKEAKINTFATRKVCAIAGFVLGFLAKALIF